MSRKTDSLDIIQKFITAEGRFNAVEGKIMNDKIILSKNEIDKIIEQELKIPRDYIYEVYVYWAGNYGYTESKEKVYRTKFLDEAFTIYGLLWGSNASSCNIKRITDGKIIEER